MTGRYGIEVRIFIDDDLDTVHSVETRALDEDGLAMALTRAVAAACTARGIDTPETLLRTAADAVRGHQASSRHAELTEIRNVLAHRGFDNHSGAHGVASALDSLRGQATLGAALGPGFGEALADAREAYRIGSLAGRDLDAYESAGVKKIPEPAQVAALTRMGSALGQLLFTLRAIDVDPVTEMPATGVLADGDVEVTGGRGEPC